jgi:hypothetical protein
MLELAPGLKLFAGTVNLQVPFTKEVGREV